MSKKKKKQENINRQSSSKGKERVRENHPLKEGSKTNKKDAPVKKQSRVQKNKNLYETEAISASKQQNYQQEKEQVEEDIDISFLDKREAKRKKVPLNGELVEKRGYSKVLLLVLAFLFIGSCLFLLYHFTTFNHHKVRVVTKIKEVEVAPENIVFLGDSITDFYDLGKYYSEHKVVNSGIFGNTTEDILKNMDERIYRYNPSHIILLIGTNDLNAGRSVDEVVESIKKIVEGIKDNRKTAKLYIEGIYPVNKEISSKMVSKRKNEDIEEVNQKLKTYCKEEKITFIDTYELLKNEDGKLKEEYSDDGLHLNDEGYEVITKKIKSYLGK